MIYISSKRNDLKILLFSGGTASTEFQKKLYEMGFIVDNIINCYDDGMSTGYVREAFDLEILGPSDLRKNQLIKHEAMYGKTGYYELLSKRFTLKDAEELKDYLYKEIDKYVKDMVNNKTLKVGVDLYINKSNYRNVEYDDFSLANIIYAGFFYKYGVQRTHDIFKELLNIKGDVVVNSEDVLILKGRTKSGKIVQSECEISYLNNKKDPIECIFLEDDDDNIRIPSLSKKASDKINEADMIIFFAGTQWSSLIPTYICEFLYESILSSKASKFLILNNENDMDMVGVTNAELVCILDIYLPLFEINIIYNRDSILDEPPNCLVGNFGTGKKHDVEKLSLFILKEYLQAMEELK